MLLALGDGKIAEDHEKNKKVIDAERKLQNVSGNKFQRDRLPLPEINDPRKNRGQAYPDPAPYQRFFRARRFAAALEIAQIDRQHAKRENIEKNPEIEH